MRGDGGPSKTPSLPSSQHRWNLDATVLGLTRHRPPRLACSMSSSTRMRRSTAGSTCSGPHLTWHDRPLCSSHDEHITPSPLLFLASCHQASQNLLLHCIRHYLSTSSSHFLPFFLVSFLCHFYLPWIPLVCLHLALHCSSLAYEYPRSFFGSFSACASMSFRCLSSYFVSLVILEACTFSYFFDYEDNPFVLLSSCSEEEEVGILFGEQG